MVGSSDLIGEAVLTLPDLGALIQSGTRRSEVPTRELRHPPATLTLTLILTLTLNPNPNPHPNPRQERLRLSKLQGRFSLIKVKVLLLSLLDGCT